MTRTDAHRPSALIPADYSYVCVGTVHVVDLGSAYFAAEQRKILADFQKETGATFSQHEHGGNCDICGSVNLIWSVIYYHRPSNKLIRVGTDCAERLEMGYDKAMMAAIKAEWTVAEKAKAGKAKAQAVLAEAGLEAAWAIYTAPTAPGKEEGIVREIVSRLVRYGSLSEAQINFVRRLVVDQIPNRAARQAERAAIKANAPDWTAGRQNVQGTIRTLREVDGGYGVTLKAFVVLEDGRTAYGTVPASVLDATVGTTILFTASITPADGDPKHGFWSRPTKAVIVALDTQAK